MIDNPTHTHTHTNKQILSNHQEQCKFPRYFNCNNNATGKTDTCNRTVQLSNWPAGKLLHFALKKKSLCVEVGSFTFTNQLWELELHSFQLLLHCVAQLSSVCTKTVRLSPQCFLTFKELCFLLHSSSSKHRESK